MDNNEEKQVVVIDEEGKRHKLIRKIGSGGQGSVFLTDDSAIVIKAKTDVYGVPLSNNIEKYAEYLYAVNEVRTLPLPKKINIAMPVMMLKKPTCGYIMKLMGGMQPIQDIMSVCIHVDMKEVFKCYINTGGLKRRLLLMKNLALILEQLHSNSIVYVDLSPGNIFIPENIEEESVWLIDADNMRIENDYKSMFGTLYYKAPEIARAEQSNNCLSDVYSFALLAFEIISLRKPFEGRLLEECIKYNEDDGSEEVLDDGWGDEWEDDCVEQDVAQSNSETIVAEDNYARAEMGYIPWIDDINNDANRTKRGIPRDVVLTKKLKELFQQTFSKEGRKIPNERPSMSEWYHAFDDAANMAIYCMNEECGFSYYAYEKKCPLCRHERGNVYIAYMWNGIFENGEVTPESINGMFVQKRKFRQHKVFLPDIKHQYLTKKDTGLNHIDDDGNTVEITKNENYYRIKVITSNLNIYANQFDSSCELQLGKGIFDVKDLDDLILIIPLSEYKYRFIRFKRN